MIQIDTVYTQIDLEVDINVEYIDMIDLGFFFEKTLSEVFVGIKLRKKREL